MAPDDAELAPRRQDFVLAQGLRETRGALDRWSADPGPVLGAWFAGAIAWVIAVTTFSLFAQAYALGFEGSTLAAAFDLSPFVLILTVLPHALPELVAIFLPLAAWLIASRRGEWGDLLAATFVTVAIAIPILLVAGMIELYVWPELLERVSPVV